MTRKKWGIDGTIVSGERCQSGQNTEYEDPEEGLFCMPKDKQENSAVRAQWSRVEMIDHEDSRGHNMLDFMP